MHCLGTAGVVKKHLDIWIPASLDRSLVLIGTTLKTRMNGLSFSELCGLFCCPPFPSRIAAKLAFLPPEPSYKLNADESGSKYTIEFNDKAEWQYSDREKENIEVFYTRTNRANKIACMYVRCSASNRFTILFSHGNAVDLGQMSSFYVGLGSRINCNIFSYDYSGKCCWEMLESHPQEDIRLMFWG